MAKRTTEGEVESGCVEAWLSRVGECETLPAVLYFDKCKPSDFDESGLYIGFIDFQNVQRDLGITDVTLTSFYHALVFYFSHENPSLYAQAREQLYNNPRNRASWRDAALTNRYYLLGSRVLPYAEECIPDDFKIPGIGKVARRVLRAVLFDDTFDMEPSDAVLFGSLIESIDTIEA